MRSSFPLAGHFQDLGEKELKSSGIGELVIGELQKMDNVAYVRFASVYRQFKDIIQFIEEVKGLIERDKSSDSPSK
jgi:transcriptional repressor NrdR